MEVPLWTWVGFIGFVLAMLALDLGVFHREGHAVSMKEAALWSAAWIALALLFNTVIYFWQGTEPALQFFTGYIIEKALSVDNLFVFALIFTMFGVPAALQHRVLFWGILGALIMRGIFVGVGATLLHHVHWMIYIFGAFLLYTGIKLARHEETEIHPERNPLIRFFRRLIPVTQSYEGQRFLVRRAGQWMATPLLLVLILVESTDLLFAVDSVPAVLAVTTNPFLVYTSNVFAILGLRALYFLLAGALDQFYYLKKSLAAILSFVGVKMLLTDIVHIPVALSLGIIGGLLIAAILASLVRARRQESSSVAA
jgi:tellurite resistance protein TerC